jgi:hypothetical protein
LSDLLKHSFSLQQLSPVGLLDAAPDLGPQLFEGGLARMLAFFEQPEAFANHLAGSLIQARGHAGMDEVLEFRGERPTMARRVGCVNFVSQHILAN